ncbi:MAG: hypothetical protein ACKV0T_24610 [Planctomycetales bacterium]
MSLLIGMDEAGYGPNLGPLVITVVVWEAEADPPQVELWNAFSGIVAREPAPHWQHLQIGDSKELYTPARGLAALETGVLVAQGLWRHQQSGEPLSFSAVNWLDFCRAVCPLHEAGVRDEPWLAGFAPTLPTMAINQTEAALAARMRLAAAWQQRCTERGLRLRMIRSDVVSPQRFNHRIRELGNKGRALSELSLELLRDVWQATSSGTEELALIIADKHGGRNRYHDLLPIAFGDEFIACREEGMDCSCYQVGRLEIRFQTQAERHLPVALASMFSKYLRELSMAAFNAFWRSHLLDLKPTAGYPVDARRFRKEIAALQQELGIPDQVLWRER